MQDDSEKPVALITGGGRGMGAAIARELHERGYRLALMSPSRSCEALAAELGGVAVRGVAEEAADIQAIFDLAMTTYGRIDAVVNHTELHSPRLHRQPGPQARDCRQGTNEAHRACGGDS